MEKFSATAFYDIAATLQRMHEGNVDPNERVSPDSKLVTTFLPTIQKRCAEIGLHLAEKAVSRVITELSDGKRSTKGFQTIIPEIHRRITDEMEEKLFMYVPPEQAAFYNQPELFGKEVNAKFPTIQFDGVEAGNSYACGRGTASVFHLMRIMEVGVQQFGAALSIKLTDQKNWQNILDEINKALKARDPKDPHTKELCQASANLYAVKLAWRNEVMHPKETYTLEEAKNLLSQVELFMRHLATVL